jgi:hypothetical protein
MNWMGKAVLIGGIYSRPLSIGNFSHFTIAGLAFLKATIHSDAAPIYLWVLTIAYAAFAVSFGVVFFTNPALKSANR